MRDRHTSAIAHNRQNCIPYNPHIPHLPTTPQTASSDHHLPPSTAAEMKVTALKPPHTDTKEARPLVNMGRGQPIHIRHTNARTGSRRYATR